MKIVHRVTVNLGRGDAEYLRSKGVSVGVSTAISSPALATFEVDESMVGWRDLQAWIRQKDGLDIVSTKFSKKEMDEAVLFALRPAWHHGYPQPDQGSFGYLDATYDLSNFCQECGIGAVQKAPFQFKAEPKWGKRNILQLNWVFGDFFVKPEVWREFLEPLGIRSRPVLSSKGKRLETVVQLDIGNEIEIDRTGVAGRAHCHACGRVKYEVVTRGFFPKVHSFGECTAMRSDVFFGSGGSAYQEVIVSREVARHVASGRILGASLWPVSLSRE